MPPMTSGVRACDDRTDDELLTLAQNADWGALLALFERHGESLRAAARRVSSENVIEVVNETFATICAKIRSLEVRSSVGGLLYGEARTAARRIRRLHTAEHSWDDFAKAVPEDVHASLREADLDMALQGLEPRLREVLVLHFLQGLSLAEIAECWACPLGTVKSRLSRALKAGRADPRLRRYWGC